MAKRDIEQEKKATLRKQILLTAAIHIVAAAVFAFICAIPSMLEWVRYAKFHSHGGEAPIGIILLVLPALFVAFIWGGDLVGTRGKVGKKILFSLWLIFNVCLSVIYLYFIGKAFPVF